MSSSTLQHRIAIVTGGESGIGAACVAALAAAGADVGIFYFKDKDAADSGVRAVQALGGRGFAVQVDVADEASVEQGYDAVADALGVPDILVNSAGLNMSGVKVADMQLEQWNRLLATDLTGSFLTCRRFVRDLQPTGRPGAIVNITSIHAFAMRTGGADYDAAKGGQANLTRTLAIEVAKRGITVNAIAPGMILTPMNDKALHDADYRESLERNIPAGRAGRPDEVAGLAVFLASPAGAYITGAQIVMDGGLSLLQGTGA
ncbi:SDR family NAD(P)-dependent oxidoreductase [Sphingomonas sp. CLY1604]|uniref:SDR family NAD(P)-dependent oxidoreductase n=1 Tax=Sphingomonas sp. CLY1604 TaxID=3457786 RepID=UPI003FD70B37